MIENGDARSGGGKSAEASAARRKEAKESVPGDRVKDAPALARELRWRVRLAAHGSSDAEDDGAENSARPGTKRRRKETPGPTSENGHVDDLRFRNFEPKRWDACDVQISLQDRARRRPPKGRPSPPSEDIPEKRREWAWEWLKFDEITEGGEKDNEMQVDSEDALPEVFVKREVITRVRRTAKGLERQRIERHIELWEWDDANTKTE